MEDGDDESGLARPGDRKERSDPRGGGLPVLSAGNGPHGSAPCDAQDQGADLDCPHGVQFYDVAEGAARSERAAWSYEAPRASMKQVDHWIGFWEDVEIE